MSKKNKQNKPSQVEENQVQLLDEGVLTVKAPKVEENQVVETVTALPNTPQDQSKQVVKARRSSYPFGDLIATSAVKAGLPRSYAYKCIKEFLEESKRLISQGHSINFSQFGSFDARMIHGKTMRTPQGKLIETQDRVRVRFHNSSKMNELMDSVGAKALEKQGFTPVFKLPSKSETKTQGTEIAEDTSDAELAELITEDFDV